MHDINPYVSDLKTMAELVSESPEDAPEIRMVFRAEGTPDPRRYNRPTRSTEVGILIIGSGGRNECDGGTTGRDIIVRSKSDGQFQRISELNQFYDPLHYILLFPTGQLGWNINTVSTSN